LRAPRNDRGVLDRLRHPAKQPAEQAVVRARRRRVVGREDAVHEIRQEPRIVRLGDGEILSPDEHRVVVEERPQRPRIGRRRIVLGNDEIGRIQPVRGHGPLDLRQLPHELGGKPAGGALQRDGHDRPSPRRGRNGAVHLGVGRRAAAAGSSRGAFARTRWRA